MQVSNEIQSSGPGQAEARDDEDAVAGANETNSDEDTSFRDANTPDPLEWSLLYPPSTLELSAPHPWNRRQRPPVKY